MKMSTLALPALAAAMAIAPMSPAQARLCDCDLKCTSEVLTRQEKQKIMDDDPELAKQLDLKKESPLTLEQCLRDRCGYDSVRSYERERDRDRVCHGK